MKAATVLTGILIAGSAAAQDRDWTCKATIYAWLPAMATSIDTRFGKIDDFGGTGAGDEPYRISAGIGYNFSENWTAQLGYRDMDISHQLGGSDVKIGLSGASIAVT